MVATFLGRIDDRAVNTYAGIAPFHNERERRRFPPDSSGSGTAQATTSLPPLCVNMDRKNPLVLFGRIQRFGKWGGEVRFYFANEHRGTASESRKMRAWEFTPKWQL